MNTAMSLTPGKLMRALRAQLKAAPRQAMILGGLVAVLLVVLIRMVFALGPATTQATPLSPTSPISTPALAGGPAPASKQAPRKAPAARRPLPELRAQAVRDIFATNWLAAAAQPSPRSAAAKPSDPPSVDQQVPELVLELTLTGATDSGQHYAVINGKRVRVGETVSGFVVETISPGLVVLLGSWRNRVVVRMD